MCDAKFRNLLTTYRSNKKKQSSTGEGGIKWEYFELFDSILGHKASSKPPDKLMGDSLLEDISIDDNTQKNTICSEKENINNNSESVKSRYFKKVKNVKKPYTIENYLEEKRKWEIEKYAEEKRLQEEKLAFEREKWQQKKDLTERQIDAILTLANAIASKK